MKAKAESHYTEQRVLPGPCLLGGWLNPLDHHYENDDGGFWIHLSRKRLSYVRLQVAKSLMIRRLACMVQRKLPIPSYRFHSGTPLMFNTSVIKTYTNSAHGSHQNPSVLILDQCVITATDSLNELSMDISDVFKVQICQICLEGCWQSSCEWRHSFNTPNVYRYLQTTNYVAGYRF